MDGLITLFSFSLLITLPSALIAASMARTRGRSWFWIIMGFFIGPLAPIILAFIGYKYICPYCRGGIHPQASVCRHCQKQLTPRVKTATGTPTESNQVKTWIGVLILIMAIVAAFLSIDYFLLP